MSSRSHLARARPGTGSGADGRAETRQRVERTRIIRDQREALSGLLVEAQREEDIARRMGRPVAEVNDLLRQRIGLQTALAANTRELTRAQEENAISFAEHGDKILDVLAQTSDAFAEGILAHVEGSKSFVDSMEAMAYGAVRAIAKMAVVEFLKNTAMGFAALATYRFAAAASSFTAAGIWAAVGVASGAGLAAMPNPNAAKPDAAKSSSSGRSASPDRQARADERSGGGPLVMNITVNGALMTQDEVHHAVGVAVRGASAAGYLAPGVH